MKETMTNYQEAKEGQAEPDFQRAENIEQLLVILFDQKNGVEKGDAQALEQNIKQLIKEYKDKGPEVTREEFVGKMYEVAPRGFMDKVFEILQNENRNN